MNISGVKYNSYGDYMKKTRGIKSVTINDNKNKKESKSEK